MNKLHKVFPTKITSKSEMKQAIKDFSGNLCKAPSFLRNDKEIVLEAVRDCPQNYRFAGSQIKEDADVKALASINSYTRKVLVYPSELENLEFLERRNIDYYKELNAGNDISDIEMAYDNYIKAKGRER